VIIKKFFLRSLFLWIVLALILELLIPLWLAKPVSARGTQGESFDEIDTYIQQQMTRLAIPGASFAIFEGDKVVHLHGFGQTRPRSSFIESFGVV
jgi:CubicO group peptidase (beta-lactamase class C family)